MPTLYGPDGRPLPSPPARDLARRIAQPTPTGWRRAQQWGSVTGSVSPARLRGILDAVASGSWCPDYFELAEQLEEKDLHYRGVLQQRKLRAAGEAIDVVAASDAAADRRIADDVRQRVLQGPGFHGMLLDLLDALGKGISCVEIVWRQAAGRWAPAAFHWVDPRWLVFDEVDGETPLLVGGGNAAARRRAPAAGTVAAQVPAEPLAPAKFLYHRHKAKSGLSTRGGLAYSVSAVWMLRSVSVRDWWAYGQIYGLPVRVGRFGRDATDEDIQTLRDALAMLASDAGCVIPDSMEVSLEMPRGSGAGGPGLFAGQAEWCDRQVSKAVVGQTMTTDDGSSRSQAEVHAEVRDDLVEDDVRQMCETLSGQLVAWYCALNFAPRSAGWPRIELPQPPEKIDLPAIMQAARGGLRVPTAWLYERLGIPPPQDGEETLGGRAAEPDPGDGDGGEGPRRRRRPPSLDAADPAAAAVEREIAELTRAGAITDELAGVVRAALAGADDAEAFVDAMADAGVPEGLAEDLALRRFMVRVDADNTGRS